VDPCWGLARHPSNAGVQLKILRLVGPRDGMVIAYAGALDLWMAGGGSSDISRAWRQAKGVRSREPADATTVTLSTLLSTCVSK
jgi:hypothetical protein